MSDKIYNTTSTGVVGAYQSELKTRGYVPDAAQLAAVQRLQRLYDQLLEFKTARQSRLRKLFSSPQPPRSVYLWGGVGRGKSFIMDCFFGSLPYRRKRRVHFHAFMQEIQNRLKQHNHEEDPLRIIADQVAKSVRLLCFDEFHVSDIADAMILGRLLQALFERGVIFVMTSNYPPDGLYPNGLQRINFLSTIALIKEKFDVLEVDVGQDYRLRALKDSGLYLAPLNEDNARRMVEDFKRLSGTNTWQSGTIRILGRDIVCLARALGVIWFDFNALCVGARSQNDYLEIARQYHTILVSDIPKMSAANDSEARRFTWLIDILYDFRSKLIVSAAVPAEQLYVEGRNAGEFQRTVSRLIEMRSEEYLKEPHRPDAY